MNGFWIIGFRAAGKTTIGRELAAGLGLEFLDLDEEFERRRGDILTFVEKSGLDAFRREEESLVREAADAFLRGHRQVVATGGGFVDWTPSREALLESPVPKLFLDISPKLLWERLEKQPDRRKIGNLSSFRAMEDLLQKRRPFYEKIASIHWKNQDINGCLAALKNLPELPVERN